MCDEAYRLVVRSDGFITAVPSGGGDEEPIAWHFRDRGEAIEHVEGKGHRHDAYISGLWSELHKELLYVTEVIYG